MNDGIGGAGMLLILVGLYFLPWIVAGFRRREPVAIFVLNLLLGWTILGWVFALVWALTGPRTPAGPSFLDIEAIVNLEAAARRNGVTLR